VALCVCCTVTEQIIKKQTSVCRCERNRGDEILVGKVVQSCCMCVYEVREIDRSEDELL